MLSASLACSDDPTQLLVVVDSDMEVPGTLSVVQAQVRDEAGLVIGTHNFFLTGATAAGEAKQFNLPLSFGVLAPTEDLDALVIVEVSAIETATAPRPLFTRRAVTRFVENKTLLLPMFLASQCRTLTCGAGQTCTESGCVSDEVDETRLKESTGPEADLVILVSETVDAGAEVADTGVVATDAEEADQGGAEDADVMSDAGAAMDASESVDSGVVLDSGMFMDAATVDTGPADSGLASDVGWSPDASMTTSDAGATAGARITCNGRNCVSMPSPLPNSASALTVWTPCGGGDFTWTAQGQFETSHDRGCVGGVATAGFLGGCSAGSSLSGAGTWSGSATGSVVVSLATDGSVRSLGITTLTAICSFLVQTASVTMNWRYSNPAGLYFNESEVMVEQYEACVMAGACTTANHRFFNQQGCHYCNSCNYGNANRNDHPMNCVNWYGATEFCAWVAARLPDENEWYAEASNGGTRAYPWGDTPQASCDYCIMNDFRAGGDGCGQDATGSVCSKPMGLSVSGLCDLSGNVWEWTTTMQGSDIIVRGGGWNSDQSYVGSVANRSRFPGDFDYTYGFRCVRDTPP